MSEKTVKFRNWDCILSFAKYRTTDATSIQLLDANDGHPIAVATVNLDVVPEKDHVFIKDWSENEGMVESLVKAGVISEPIGEIPTGFVTAKICKLLI